jgi:mevalonate pyrophosphate decarboxylase
MTEAMNGQASFDSDEARILFRKSDTYKMWAEMAELERKTLQEASTMTDTKAMTQKLTETQEKRDKLNKVLMESIKAAS